MLLSKIHADGSDDDEVRLVLQGDGDEVVAEALGEVLAYLDCRVGEGRGSDLGGFWG